MHGKVLSPEAFVVAARKAFLRNQDRVTWEDLSMILLVAEKLDYFAIVESPSYLSFVQVLYEIVDMKVSDREDPPVYRSFMIVVFALYRFCYPRAEFEEVFQKCDQVLITTFHANLLRNQKSLYKLVALYTT